MNEEIIKKLMERGFKRWTKGPHDRLYVNADALGLYCEFYNTGNIRYASFSGEKISNSYAARLRAAKTYIDVNTGKIYGTNNLLIEAAKNMLSEALESNADLN